jgi:hypothetical protein
MAEIPIGTLVRVRDSALTNASMHRALNLNIVRSDGYLYFVEYRISDEDDDVEPGSDDAYRCKSLATGNRGIVWYYDEIEATEEQTNG